jgi:hypothetical protein
MKISSILQVKPKSSNANIIHGMNLSKFGSKEATFFLNSEKFIGKSSSSECHQLPQIFLSQ